MENQNGIACQIRQRTLMVTDGAIHYNFDRSGRFLFLTEPGRAVRRGLDHRMVESLQPPGRPQKRRYRDLTQTEKDAVLARAYQSVQTCLMQLTAQEAGSFSKQTSHISTVPEQRDTRLELDWLQKILAWQSRGLEMETKAFRRTYLPISILPPDQYHSLVVQVTEGCSYNRCLFCDFYRDRPFKIKSDEALREHLGNIQAFFGERLSDMDEIFLGDGNALVVPTQSLLSMLTAIQTQLGKPFSTISTFVDTFTLDKKTEADLARLHEAGLNTAYIGFETGLDELRRTLKKPGTAAEAAEAVRLLKHAGWRVAIILLVSIGERGLAARHLHATVEALASIPLEGTDLIYLSPFVEPNNSPYLAASPQVREQLVPASSHDVNKEFQLWKQAILSRHEKVKISLYPIRQHLY